MTPLHRILSAGTLAVSIMLYPLDTEPARAASEQVEQPCDLGPCLPSQPKPPIVHTGRFASGYQQIYCRREPCPPGGSAIILPDRPPMQVKAIAFAPGTPRHLSLSFNSSDPRRKYVVFEGSVAVAYDRSIAVIRPRSAAYASGSGGIRTSAPAPGRQPPPRP